MCSIHTLYVGIAQTNVLLISLIISKAMMLSLLLVWM